MNLFADNNHLNIFVVLVSVFLLAAIVYIRYLLFSGVYYLFFYKWFQKTFTKRLLHKKKWKKRQVKKELYYSLLSGFIFSVVIIITFILYIEGYTKVYKNTGDFSLWYIPVSVFLVLFLQDTYYYWMHRWMHKPNIYKYFHLVHHKSVHTTVFTSFSFHPLETISQAIFIPIVALCIPLHIYAVLSLMVIMTISATINHAGVEVYPSGKLGNWFKRNFIGATHHDLHHTKFNHNYGLYFTFWDRLMGTEFEKKKG